MLYIAYGSSCRRCHHLPSRSQSRLGEKKMKLFHFFRRVVVASEKTWKSTRYSREATRLSPHFSPTCFVFMLRHCHGVDQRQTGRETEILANCCVQSRLRRKKGLYLVFCRRVVTTKSNNAVVTTTTKHSGLKHHALPYYDAKLLACG